mgnify:CR=1 FL=1
MQDGGSCDSFVRALVIWSGALAGLMMILVGGLLPSALIIPGQDLLSTRLFSLPSTWQVPSLLLTALVCGPRAAVIASVAYITVGLLYLPIFHSGGSFSYVTTPGFGYLIGFVPTAWISGRLAYRRNMNNLISLTLCSVIGLILLQIWGVIYIIIGSLVGDWALNLPDLVYSYSIAPLPAQLLLCPGVGIASLTLRQLLFIE